MKESEETDEPLEVIEIKREDSALSKEGDSSHEFIFFP
jgi:hypothetical protein